MTQKTSNDLTLMMNEYGSDKGSGHHNYTDLYFDLLKDHVDKSLNLFEVGLGTNYLDIPSSMGTSGTPGASLRGWREFLPKSNIYGADIDRRILFSEDRIKTFYVDQTDPKSIEELWSNDELKDIQFDIFIDDGLHHVDANICLLKNSFHKLKPKGGYIIEDIIVSWIPALERELEELKHELGFTYTIYNIPNAINTHDNVLAVLKKN
jgi:SAM-dependent methyltransferase